MATEILNTSGSGVNIGQPKAADIRPFGNSEGRTSLSPIDLSGLGQLAKTVGEGYGQRAGQQRAAAQAANLGSFAAEEEQIRLLGSQGANPNQIAKVALGYGDDIAPERVAELEQFRAFTEDLRSKQTRGASQLGVELAIKTHRLRRIEQNPDLAQEYLKVSGQGATLSKTADDLAFEEEANTRALKKAGDQARATDLNSHGYSTDGLSATQANTLFLEKRALQIRALEAGAAVLKNIEIQKATGEITDYQARKTAFATASKLAPDLTQYTVGEINKAVNALPKNADAKLVYTTYLNALNARISAAASTIGYPPGSPEFKQAYGPVFEPLQALGQDYATGKLTLDGLKNENAKVYALADKDLVANNPDINSLALIQDKVGLLINTFGNADLKADVVIKTQDILKSALNYTTAVNKGEPAPLPQGATNLRENKQGQEALDAVASKAGDVVKLVKDYTTNPKLKDAGNDYAIADRAYSVFTDKDALKNPKSISAVLPALADPAFVQITGGKVAPERVQIVLGEYRRSVEQESARLLTKERGNIIVKVDQSGQIHYDLKAPTQNAGAVKRAELDVNNWVKAYAHANGQASPEAYHRVIESIRQEAANNGG